MTKGFCGFGVKKCQSATLPYGKKDGIKRLYKIMFWIHWKRLWWIRIGWKEEVYGGWIKEGRMDRKKMEGWMGSCDRIMFFFN